MQISTSIQVYLVKKDFVVGSFIDPESDVMIELGNTGHLDTALTWRRFGQDAPNDSVIVTSFMASEPVALTSNDVRSTLHGMYSSLNAVDAAIAVNALLLKVQESIRVDGEYFQYTRSHAYYDQIQKLVGVSS